MPSNRKKKKGNKKTAASSSMPHMTQEVHNQLNGTRQEQERLQKLENELPNVFELERTTDPFLRELLDLRADAKRLGLFDLNNFLVELCGSLYANQRESMMGCLIFVQGYGAGVSKNQSTAQIRRTLEELGRQLLQAFCVFGDRNLCEQISKDAHKTLSTVQLLSCKSKFDMGHEMQSMQGAMMRGIRGNSPDEDGKVREFLAGNPLDKLRREELGYENLKRMSATLTTADQSNELGKKAWKRGSKWAAEMLWARATELDPSATKCWSNLALARIHLGRNLRSKGIGYRQPATDLLEAAYNDGAKGFATDPQWERAYVRAAQAALALGPMDRAMDACRVLKTAIQTLPEPHSEELLVLYDTARTNASLWCRMPRKGTIPQIIEAALRELRSTIVRNLSWDTFSEDELKAAGEDIVGAAKLVTGAMQLIYLRRAQWVRESKAVNMEMNDIQIQLRQVSKLVPLKAVQASDSLKRLVFSEDPFGLWGLDRLDRKAVDSLPFDAADPCESDLVEAEDPQMQELLQRNTGGESMPMSQMLNVVEMMGGKSPHSTDKDMTPHHRCSFTVSVLQRLVMASDSPLQKAATDRVVDLTLSSNGNGMWAGGEFIGMCINAAAGIGKYGLPSDPTRTARFIQTAGGVTVMAKEICNSTDAHFYFQNVLADVSPETWASLSAFDISNLFLHYVLPGMDGDAMGLKKEEIAPFVVKIVSKLLDGYPDMLDYLRTGNEPSNIRPFRPLFWSAFGTFLTRRYMYYEKALVEKDLPSATADVLNYMVTKWNKLSRDKRSAYRWESYDAATKKKLAGIAPVSLADMIQARKENNNADDRNKGALDRTVNKLPECAACGKAEGLGVELLSCACRVVRYCSETCQKDDWPVHKTLCKEIRSSTMG